MSAPKIITVGSIALDTLETPSGKVSDALGGSSTYFALAASMFAPVHLVGVVGTDFPEAGWDLFKSRNIDVTDVQIVDGKTFRWGGRYSDDLHSRDTLFTELGVFENFQPVITEQAGQADLVFLGNIHPGLQKAVCERTPNARFIVTDTMNLWIDISRNELMDVIRKTDIFLLNDEEAIQLTGKDDLNKAADTLLAYGPSVVIIKQGRRGSLLADGQTRIRIPVVPGITVVDPTGAGDSFAGGLLGYLANHSEADLIPAVIQATAVASFTVSGLGVEGLLVATPDVVIERVKRVSSMMK